MGKTKIEWTHGIANARGATWNPIKGCSLKSPGCKNCYAMRQAMRMAGPGRPYEGLVRSTSTGPKWTGLLRYDEEALDYPLRLREPHMIFVNSMSDLFHEKAEEWWIDEVFAYMAVASWHTFQVLTKRAERMRAYMRDPETVERVDAMMHGIIDERVDPNARRKGDLRATAPNLGFEGEDWPLKNVWLGVSVENQETADERIPVLMQTPTAVRWVSAEPLIGPVDFTKIRVGSQPGKEGAVEPITISAFENACLELRPGCADFDQLDWCVVGGESGPGARPFDPAWARQIRDACATAKVPYFLKQMGAVRIVPGHPIPVTYPNKGGDPTEWDEDLRVRQYPHANGMEGQ